MERAGVADQRGFLVLLVVLVLRMIGVSVGRRVVRV